MAYGGFQARGGIGAVAAGLCQSRDFELHHSSWLRQILNPLSKARDRTHISWILVRFVSAEPQWELLNMISFNHHNPSPYTDGKTEIQRG